jgi:hypothetical protein
VRPHYSPETKGRWRRSLLRTGDGERRTDDGARRGGTVWAAGAVRVADGLLAGARTP